METFFRIQDMKVMETRKTVLQKEQRMLFARALAAGFKVADMLTLISSAKLFWNLTFDVRKFNIFRYSFIVLMCENRPLQAINGLQEFRRESASHYVCSLVMWFRKFAMHFLEGFSSSDLNQRYFVYFLLLFLFAFGFPQTILLSIVYLIGFWDLDWKKGMGWISGSYVFSVLNACKWFVPLLNPLLEV